LPSLETIENDRQLALYSIGVKERYPDMKNIRLVWHFLRFDRKIDSTRTDEELEELKQTTIQLIGFIETTEEFSANPSRLCNWCGFKTLCGQ
jgi:putative RecB family exonuclease